MKHLEASKAAETLCSNGRALVLLHTYYDDARQRGLPPHHAINAALGKLSKLQMAGAKYEDGSRTEDRGKVCPRDGTDHR